MAAAGCISQRQWSDGSAAWSAHAEFYFRFHLLNSANFTDYADSGASKRITSRRTEVDFIKSSNLTWGGAAAHPRHVDGEGLYRYFIPDPEGNIGFMHVPCLVVDDFGSLALTSTSQFNELGIGFDSPPVNVDAPEVTPRPPYLYVEEPEGPRRVIAYCPKAGDNGLPLVPAISTHTAAQRVYAGAPLVDLRTRKPISWDAVLPHLPLKDLAARPNIQDDSPFGVAQTAQILNVSILPSANDSTDVDLDKLTADQRGALFDAAMREGNLGIAFSLLKEKERKVQLQYARWLHPSPDKFEALIRGTTGHGLSPGDSRHLQESLSRWRSSMTAKRRVRYF